jgi:hypothetical protein
MSKIVFRFQHTDGRVVDVDLSGKYERSTEEGEKFGMDGLTFAVDSDLIDNGVRTVVLLQTDDPVLH